MFPLSIFIFSHMNISSFVSSAIGCARAPSCASCYHVTMLLPNSKLQYVFLVHIIEIPLDARYLLLTMPQPWPNYWPLFHVLLFRAVGVAAWQNRAHIRSESKFGMNWSLPLHYWLWWPHLEAITTPYPFISFVPAFRVQENPSYTRVCRTLHIRRCMKRRPGNWQPKAIAPMLWIWCIRWMPKCHSDEMRLWVSLHIWGYELGTQFASYGKLQSRSDQTFQSLQSF